MYVNMACNRITKPEFTKAQIAECGKCKHASARVAWCGLFGVHIIEAGTIVMPKRKYPSMAKMAGTFVKSTGKQIFSGNPKRSSSEIKRIIAICRDCDYFNQEKQRCYKCGCKMNRKIPWRTTVCNIGKW